MKQWAYAVLRPLIQEVEIQTFLSVQSELRHTRSSSFARIQSAEFRVFSQFGEDGILQYLIHRVPVQDRSFVEFGVGDYRQANTRFLLQNDNWKGLIIDGGPDHIRFLDTASLRWRHEIDGIQAFLTAENVDQVIASGGFGGGIGILSVDIDGNDYWILKAISVVSPYIVVCEYNSIFGSQLPVSIPYQSDFARHRAHCSGLYFGASLPAICSAMSAKNYRFVGSNSAGVNAFFVREDVAGDLPALTAAEGWVASRHRDSRDRSGRHTFVTGAEAQLRLIQEMTLVNVVTGEERAIRDWFGLG